jgi:hypothetical protein
MKQYIYIYIMKMFSLNDTWSLGLMPESKSILAV